MKLDDIRQLYDLVDIVASEGVKLKGSATKKWCVCPFPDHSHHAFTPSFSIFWGDDRQRFKCHGLCGRFGDVIDFIGYMNDISYDPNDFEHYKKAAEILTGGKFVINPPTKPPPAPSIPQWLADEFVPPNDATVRYALSRGLTAEQIERFNIGSPTMEMKEEPYNLWDPHKWMAIPTFHGDELIGIKIRNMGRGRLRYMGIAGSKKGLFNYNAVNMRTDPVLVLKGEIAVMVADRFGLLACAPTGGEGSIVDVKSVLAFAKVLVIGDNDNHEAARKRARLLDAELAFPPPEWNGFDDWLLDDPSAIEITQDWMFRIGEPWAT